MRRSPEHFFATIEVVVRRVRPHETRDGAALVRDAMALIAADRCQRAKPEPTIYGPAASGYVDDPRSVRTQRLLLAALYRGAAT